MTRNLCFVVLIAAAAVSLSSCTDTQSPQANNTGVSTIPWNRPEKWENGSQLPGGLTGSR